MQENTQIFGIRTIIEAINSEQTLEKVYIQKGLKGELIKELESLLRRNEITVSYVPPEKLNRLTKNNHQGAVANISPIGFTTLESLIEKAQLKEKPALFLLLDQLSDVRNFGAIIRTAECSGVDGIIIQKKGAAPVTEAEITQQPG